MTTKTHSPKRIVLRIVLAVAIVFALLAAAWGVHWVYLNYIEFNTPILTGTDPFEGAAHSLKDIDKLTDSDKAMAKKILDEKGIPYREMYGTIIVVRTPQSYEASYALYDSGYEFDGILMLG